MLDAIQALADDGLHFDREAVELAAWFHDAIYDIGRDDNEDRSAELARELLSTSPVRDEVARLVLATKTHKVSAGDINGAVLSDADLSVLGAPAAATSATRPRCARSTTRSPTTCSNRPGRVCSPSCSTGRCSTPGPGATVGRIRRAATSQPRSRR